MITIDKNSNERICYGLTNEEAKCRCNLIKCKETRISQKLITAYIKFRGLVGVPLIINSLYRCAVHNASVGGVLNSRHLISEAVDISLKSLSHLDEEEIEHLLRLCGFTFILFYKSFVHADCR